MQQALPRFIADVHLGKLARWLRMLGFDTYYDQNLDKSALLEIASKENRILLSKNSAFSKEPEIPFLKIESEHPIEQLQQVNRRFEVINQALPFSRCLVCNGSLLPVSREKIYANLQSNTATYYDHFWQCTDCKRIYWKGSHYNRMQDLIHSLKADADQE